MFIFTESAVTPDDFILEAGELMFSNGQTESTINITIVDDTYREMPEFFQVLLMNVTGGALLGTRTSSYVTIAKSDYPNGRFSFTGPQERILANPESTFVLELGIARTEGLVGAQTLSWRILGPNSLTPLQETGDVSYVSADDMEVTQGQLTWQDGEAGTKLLPLFIKSYSGWEIEKKFVVEIVDIQNDVNPQDNGEADPLTSQVTVTVLKHGDPNGIIQFSDVSLTGQEFTEPDSGQREVSFFIERKEGNLGDQQILWEVIGREGGGEGEVEADVSPMSGSALMVAGVSSAAIRLNILADELPELTENFELHLRNVIGGATLRLNASSTTFTIQYNDDPHGVFEINSTAQSLDVDTVSLQRYLTLNIDRNAGLVGSVRVTVGVTFSQTSTSFPLTQSVVFDDGQASAEMRVDIVGGIFIELDSYFTVVISEVVYLGGADFTSLPRIGEANTVTIPVPAIAANSYVSFSQTISSVNELTQESSITLIRRGLYGNIEVSWTQGYPPDAMPVGFSEGVISPSTGTVYIGHGVGQAVIRVTVLLPSLSAQTRGLFAVSLLDDPVTSAAGGARLSPVDITTEIEPSGVIRFSESSVYVDENQGSVTLTLQRYYGTRRNVQVLYSTVPLTALSTNDFSAVESQAVILTEMTEEGNITIVIQIDSLAEQEESFLVLIHDVSVLPTTELVTGSPRVSDRYSNCTVTIRENGDPYGLLDVIVSPVRVVEGNLNMVSM